jgi:hypothetical protein
MEEQPKCQGPPAKFPDKSEITSIECAMMGRSLCYKDTHANKNA